MIIGVGGWHGVRALLSLVLTIVVVIKILVPALLEGVAPVPLAIGVSLLVTAVSILLTEGASRWSLAAILGTIGGLAATAIISMGFGRGEQDHRHGRWRPLLRGAAMRRGPRHAPAS